ncbi:hypothetical protein KM043_004683 [Ampulex compressa]|nr:hypothetical protein KM043_004683 [Ampulex compressa]
MQAEDGHHRVRSSPYAENPEKIRKVQQDTEPTQGQITPLNQSPEKTRKTPQSSSKFVDVLIQQWSKISGTQFPALPKSSSYECGGTEEIKQKYINQELQINILKRKLKEAEEAVTAFNAGQENELRIKEEISTKLNATWEAIHTVNKYLDYVFESIKGFQEHRTNLSSLYDNVMTLQQTVVEKLRRQVEDFKRKDGEQRKLLNNLQKKVIDAEERARSIAITNEDLRAQLQKLDDRWIVEKQHLIAIHEEAIEKLEKELTNLKSDNEELNSRLNLIEDEKRQYTNTIMLKESCILELQKEITMCKDENEVLMVRNKELSEQYEKSLENLKELSEELESKSEQVKKIRENAESRKEIEVNLAKDVDKMAVQCTEQVKMLKDMERRLIAKEEELRNVESIKSQLENTMRKNESNSESEMVQLKRKLDSMRIEMDKAILDRNTKISDLERSQKSLQEKHKSELAILRKEFGEKFMVSERKAVEEKSTIVSLNESLATTQMENENLREQLYQTKNANDQLQSKLKEISEVLTGKSIVELQLREMCKAYEKKLKTDEEFSQIGNKMDTLSEERSVVEREKVRQSKRSTPIKSGTKSPRRGTTATSAKKDVPADNQTSKEIEPSSERGRLALTQTPRATKKMDTQKSSSSQKNSTPEASNAHTAYDLFQGEYWSQLQPISTELSKKSKNTEGVSVTPRGRRFFKNRTVVKRTYENQHK